jgi:hypothetical protein
MPRPLSAMARFEATSERQGTPIGLRDYAHMLTADHRERNWERKAQAELAREGVTVRLGAKLLQVKAGAQTIDETPCLTHCS